MAWKTFKIAVGGCSRHAAGAGLCAWALDLQLGWVVGAGGGGSRCSRGGLGSLSVFEGHPGDVLRGLCHSHPLVQLLLVTVRWHCQAKGKGPRGRWILLVLLDAGGACPVADTGSAGAGASPALSPLMPSMPCNPHLPPQLSWPPVTPRTPIWGGGSLVFGPAVSPGSRSQHDAPVTLAQMGHPGAGLR